MKSRLSVFFLAVLASVPLLQSASAVASLHTDVGSWNSIGLRKDLDRAWSFSFKNEFKLKSHFTQAQELLVKWMLSYRVSRRVKAGLGYGWTPDFNPYENENRIWEEAVWRPSGRSDRLSFRTRIEQRFIQILGASYRFRARVSAGFPVRPEAKISLFLFEEILLNANSLPPSHLAGVDENRFFVGFNVEPSEPVRWRFGAQSVYSRSAEPKGDLLSEVLLVDLTVKY